MGDVVRALLAALPAASVQAPVLNVCTGSAVSVRGLAAVVSELTGRRAEIRRRPARAGEIRHSVGSPTRARRVLGLGDTTPLRDGLRATLDWLEAEVAHAVRTRERPLELSRAASG